MIDEGTLVDTILIRLFMMASFRISSKQVLHRHITTDQCSAKLFEEFCCSEIEVIADHFLTRGSWPAATRVLRSLRTLLIFSLDSLTFYSTVLNRWWMILRRSRSYATSFFSFCSIKSLSASILVSSVVLISSMC